LSSLASVEMVLSRLTGNELAILGDLNSLRE